MEVSEIEKVLKTPFQAWDKCCICRQYKSPLIWIKDNKEYKIHFVCEECFKKIKEAG